MKEHLQDREKRMEADLAQSTLSIFVWGFLCGAIAAYSSLLPMLIGMTIGVALAYKKSEFVNFLILRSSALIHRITQKHA
jgi:ABC-type multidrug transport system permease subunit